MYSGTISDRVLNGELLYKQINFLESLCNIALYFLKHVPESHVVECPMVSFIHKDYRR